MRTGRSDGTDPDESELGHSRGWRVWSNQRGNGGYLLLYPNVRVFAMLPLGFFVTSIALPAWAMLGYWFLIQFVSGLAAFGSEIGGVAFWAHVGGFVAGVVLVKLFARSDYISAHRAHHWRPRRLMRD